MHTSMPGTTMPMYSKLVEVWGGGAGLILPVSMGLKVSFTGEVIFGQFLIYACLRGPGRTIKFRGNNVKKGQERWKCAVGRGTTEGHLRRC